MATDDLSETGLEELVEMAARLGFQRHWIHWNHRLPHFDLTPEARAAAVRLGALGVSTRELVRRCRGPSWSG